VAFSLCRPPVSRRLCDYLTDETRATVDDNEMFAPEPLRELFERIEYSDRFRELAKQPRPAVDAKTTPSTQ
jgi:hypothetical protein